MPEIQQEVLEEPEEWLQLSRQLSHVPSFCYVGKCCGSGNPVNIPMSPAPQRIFRLNAPDEPRN